MNIETKTGQLRESIETLSDRGRFAIDIASRAGNALLPVSGDSMSKKDGISNVVTSGDYRSDNTIKTAIKEKYSSDHILSEEDSNSLSDTSALDRLWVIDPLDGSKNQSDGISDVNVSIAYVENGEVISGAIYNPYTKQLFFAEKGKGAYYIGPRFVGSPDIIEGRLSVSQQDDLSKASVETSISYDANETVNHQLIKLEMYRNNVTPRFREIGSSVGQLARVARGTSDLHFHGSLKPWDYAAGMLLVSEAGGVNKKLNGDKATFINPGIVSGNEALVDQFTVIYNKIRGNEALIAWIKEKTNMFGGN